MKYFNVIKYTEGLRILSSLIWLLPCRSTYLVEWIDPVIPVLILSTRFGEPLSDGDVYYALMRHKYIQTALHLLQQYGEADGLPCSKVVVDTFSYVKANQKWVSLGTELRQPPCIIMACRIKMATGINIQYSWTFPQ